MAKTDQLSAIEKWNGFYFSLTEGEKEELLKLAHQSATENDEDTETKI